MAEKVSEKSFFQQLGIGVSSLTFGVALSIFIYAFASGIVTGLQAWLLFGASFLLMLRFWWRYNELFVRFLPSQSYLHFLLDFAISFFGILAVLLVNNIQAWALVGAAAMIASAIRCGLSWRDASNKSVKRTLKLTILGSLVMLIVMAAVYFLATVIENVALSATIFVIVLIFIIYASRK